MNFTIKALTLKEKKSLFGLAVRRIVVYDSSVYTNYLEPETE
jgi:Arc/MetJ family transcription regulator